MPECRSLVFGFVFVGVLSACPAWAQVRPPYYPGGTRLTIAAEICFGPFSAEEFDKCVDFLIRGDFSLADDAEFVVLRNFVVIANTNFDPRSGFFKLKTDIDQTLLLFATVEGVRFSRNLTSNCVLRYLNIGAVIFGRNDGEYLNCVESHIISP